MKVGREGRVEHIAAEPKPRESVDAFSPPGHSFEDEGPQAASRKESLNAPALSLGAKLSPSESAAKGIAHWAAMLQEAKTPEEVDLIRASLDQTYQDYQTHLKGWKGWALSPFRSALAGTGAISSPQQIEEAYKDAVKQSIARAQTTRSAQDIVGIMRRVAQNMELLFPDKKPEIAEILGLTKQRLESAKSQDPATEKKILDNLSTIAFTLTNATSPALRFKTLDHLVLEAFKQYAGLTLDQNLRAMFYKKPENERMATMRALQRTLSDPAFASRSREETKSHFVKTATEEKLRMAGVPKANIEPLAQLIESQRSLSEEALKQLGQTPEFQPAWHPQLNIEPELFYSDVLQGLADALGQPEHSALFAGVKEGKTPQEVEQLFHSHKDSLRETTLSKVSETVKQLMNEKDPLQYVIEKWAGNNTVKFAQGKLGAGEVLGEGVCLGLSLRVLQALLENPDLADADLQADQVLPSDRFLQASHLTHMRVGKWRQGWDSMTPAQMENLEWNVPRSYLRKRGLSLKSLEGSVPWEAKSWPWLQAKLMDRPLMQKSGAALLLKFPHHATALQVDPQKGIYRFYDPNFGVYRFENASELVSFMKDLAPVYGENAKFKVLKLQRSS